MSQTENQLKEATKILKADGVVAIPTETVYGLAARISSSDGIKKIFAVKERPFFDPLIVHISSINQLKDLTPEFNNPLLLALAKSFWPGPLSIIVPKISTLDPLITSGLDTVAIRMPNQKLALELINQVGEPLAAPSANKFGKTSPTSALHVRESLKDIFVLDGDLSEIGIESTVIRPNLNENQKLIEILRPGFINKNDFLKVLGTDYRIETRNSLASPGNIEHHYMPDVPLVMVNKILTNDNFQILKKELGKQNLVIVELELDFDSTIAARQLYYKLREVSGNSPDLILFSVSGRHGELWDAIFDRLKRASTFNFSSL